MSDHRFDKCNYCGEHHSVFDPCDAYHEQVEQDIAAIDELRYA